MTPEERLEAAANLARAVEEIKRAGKLHREKNARNDRS